MGSGYKVWETEAERRHWGGIAIFWREEEGLEVEGAQSFGTNVVSFIVTLGQKCWYVVRAYMPPNDLPGVHHITNDLTYDPEGVGKMLVGNLNACLAHSRDKREEHLAIVITIHGLTYQAYNFTPRQRYRAEGKWTWRMWREGRPILG